MTEEELREKVHKMVRDLAEYEDQLEREVGPEPMSPEAEELIKTYFPDPQDL